MLSDLLIVERKANEIISRCLGKVSKLILHEAGIHHTKIEKKDVKIKSHSH